MMADPGLRQRREDLIKFIIRHQDEDRALIFQVLDTIRSNYIEHGVIPSLERILNVPALVKPAYPGLAEYIASIQTSQGIEQEMYTLAFLRPSDGTQLPNLARRTATLAELSAVRDHTRDHGLVESFRHASQLVKELNAVNNKTILPGHCQDVPQTAQERQVLKKELFMAIVDTSVMIEAQDNSEVRKVKQMKNVEIEVMAWRILDHVLKAQEGEIDIPGSGVVYKTYPSFKARFDAVKDAVLKSKCTVGSLMRVDYMKRLVADPTGELAKKQTNKEQNQKKTRQIQVAHKAAKAGYASKDKDGLYTWGDQATPAPPLPASGGENDLLASRPKKRVRAGSTEDGDTAGFDSMLGSSGFDSMLDNSPGAGTIEIEDTADLDSALDASPRYESD